MKNFKKTNDQTDYENLTTEELKKYKGFENISENEAQNLLETYTIYIELLFNAFQKEVANEHTLWMQNKKTA